MHVREDDTASPVGLNSGMPDSGKRRFQVPVSQQIVQKDLNAKARIGQVHLARQFDRLPDNQLGYVCSEGNRCCRGRVRLVKGGCVVRVLALTACVRRPPASGAARIRESPPGNHLERHHLLYPM